MFFQKIISAFALLAFSLWIIPLGAFIKPYQEMKVCGGQRAICLCTHLKSSVKIKGQSLIVKVPSSAEKETGSQLGSFWLTTEFSSLTKQFSRLSYFLQPFLYEEVILNQQDPVPKV